MDCTVDFSIDEEDEVLSRLEKLEVDVMGVALATAGSGGQLKKRSILIRL